MDSLITAAARALAAGDPLSALKLVALRDDPPALALRAIALAQLGEFARATQLLRQAMRGFGSKEPVARARCVVAQAEIALASRDLRGSQTGLAAAQRMLEAHGDHVNALHARLVAIRRALLLGRVAEAEQLLSEVELDAAPPMLAAIAELARGEVALRRVHARAARTALTRARAAAERARIPALRAEIERALHGLTAPAARVIAAGHTDVVDLLGVEALLGSRRLVVDAFRRNARVGTRVISLARRPVLFALVRPLAAAYPNDVARDALVADAFGARRSNESHRVRLRVEVGRLRKLLQGVCDVVATPRGFVLAPRARQIALLAPLVDGHDTALLALLADGERWSTSALALALGSSQRGVQRVLSSLQAAGLVRCDGRARARRWFAPAVSEMATTLLLPAAPPIG